MFGIDSLLRSIQGLFTRIKEFMGLVDSKGIGGAFTEVVQNSATDLLNETRQQFASIPQTLKLGEDILKQFSASGTTGTASSVAENSPPATTPATPASPQTTLPKI